MPATPPSSSSSSGQRRSRSASPPTPGPPTPPESQLLAASEDEQQSSPPPSGPVSKIDDSQPSTGSTADQPGLRSPQDQTNASSRSLDDDRPCNEAGKDDSITTPRPSGSTSPELQTQPQSQSPHSSPSSPLQTRSPRQNGLERSSSEEAIGNDALTEGGGSSIDSNEERTSTATTSATGAVTTEAGHSDADGEVFSDEWLADMRRVKVYELIGQRWTDRGTALCTGIYDEEVDQAAIVARSEISDVELLRSEIRVNDVYQRQQETLIVWTEPDGTDYALSFQDVDGCAEIWDFIIEVQRHFRGKLGETSGPSSSSPNRDPRAISANSIINAGRLPEPTLGIIGEIDKAIKFIGRTAAGKEKICEYIVQEDYIKGLIDVLGQAEDLEALGDLHALCNLMQTILMMNDHSIYDYILQDDIYMGVIGMLEYDPDFPTYKASFRDYLANSTQYKEVVAFRDETIKKKIHQTYRLQYLKDVVLARVLDDPTFNVLNSFIVFNQIDIINHIQNDETLLKDLFHRFEKPNGEDVHLEPKPSADTKGKEKEVNGTGASSKGSVELPPYLANLSTSDIAKRDIIILLHQLCMMGKNVQIPSRLALYRALVDKGLLHALQWALSRPAEDVQMLNCAGEILLIVCDHDVTGVRSFVVKQADPNGEWEKATPAKQLTINQMGSMGIFGTGSLPGIGGMSDFGGSSGSGEGLGIGGMPPPGTGAGKSDVTTLLTVIVKVLTSSKDLALRGQMAESLKSLLELPNNDDSTNIKGPARPREDPITERFLQYFYDSCIMSLYRPIMDLPEFKAVTGPVYNISRDQSSLFLFLCDNLSNFVTQHSHRSQYFVLSTNISRRIATLLKSKEKHVRLAALRFFRVCLKMNNNFFIRHLIKNEVFLPILDLSQKESKRDNLINCACQEFFEHARKENIRIVINHMMEKYEPKVRELCKYGSMGERFRGLVLRWEQNNEPAPKESQTQDKNGIRRLARPGQALINTAMLDAEEQDDYFNASDDEDFMTASSPPAAPQSPPIMVGMKRKRANRIPVLVNGNGSPAPSASGNSPRQRQQTSGGIVLPSPYPIKLVDYDDAEDDPSSPRDSVTPPPSSPEPHEGSANKPSKIPTPSGSLMRTRSTTNLAMTNGTGKSVNGSPSASPKPLRPDSPPRLSEKRRREEDEDDMLGNLSSGSQKNAKKQTGPKPGATSQPDNTTTNPNRATSPPSATGIAGGIAKRIKLSLGKSGFGIAAHVPVTTTPKKEEEMSK
ncbi:Platinum sensitivity protein [Tulasnella sp. 424]|nr:Platinum sensitivity protein [Tulasnella sp. 424]